jgi:hypothetical protein
MHRYPCEYLHRSGQKRRSVKRAYLRVDLTDFLTDLATPCSFRIFLQAYAAAQAVKASWTYPLLSFLAAALSLPKHSHVDVVADGLRTVFLASGMFHIPAQEVMRAWIFS